MIRLLIGCAAAVTVALALAAALASHGTAATVSSVIAPQCPHPKYGADGNISPLFCIIDNPVAVSHFAPLAKRTFALGPDATPAQVEAGLIADYKHGGTGPILCSVYKLASWRNNWAFGISVISNVGMRLNFPSGWCSEPSFTGTE